MGLSKEHDLAVKACNYARKTIVIGSSWLETNNYSPDAQDALWKALNDVRDINLNFFGINGQLAPNAKLITHYSMVEASKKYSIGNCGEMSRLALNFAKENGKDINSERFSITGGDHIVLVVGHDKLASPNNPYKWGPNAYICDPWANEVYPAIEYLTKLKDYYRKGKLNFIKDFDPCTQSLFADSYLSDQIDEREKSILQLKNNYLQIQKKLYHIYTDLIYNIKAIIHRNKRIYGKNNEATIIIIQHLGSLKRYLDNVIGQVQKVNDIELDNYKVIAVKLSQKLLFLAQKCSKIMTFTSDEENSIGQQSKTSKAKLLHFFTRQKRNENGNPYAEKINEAFAKSNAKIKDCLANTV